MRLSWILLAVIAYDLHRLAPAPAGGAVVTIIAPPPAPPPPPPRAARLVDCSEALGTPNCNGVYWTLDADPRPFGWFCPPNGPCRLSR